jgi:hypothetical protein
MAAVAMSESDIRSKIMGIMMDESLTDEEKGRRRQELLMGRWAKPEERDGKKKSCSESIQKGGRIQNLPRSTRHMGADFFMSMLRSSKERNCINVFGRKSSVQLLPESL